MTIVVYARQAADEVSAQVGDTTARALTTLETLMGTNASRRSSTGTSVEQIERSYAKHPPLSHEMAKNRKALGSHRPGFTDRMVHSNNFWIAAAAILPMMLGRLSGAQKKRGGEP